MLPDARVSRNTCCQLHILPIARVASWMCCKLPMLAVAHVACCTCCQLHVLLVAYVASCVCCHLHVLPVLCVASCMCCQLHVLPVAHVASCTCCLWHMLPIACVANWKSLKLKYKNLWNKNNSRNLSNTEISQLQRTHYKSFCNWIKSSVSSMTSAEEGQPPSNEPEEWQETHPLLT